MTLQQCAESGHDKVRKPYWAFATDYMRIDINNGRVGPWGHLFAAEQQEMLGQPTPQDILLVTLTKDDDWVPYTPKVALSPSDARENNR